MAVMHTMGCRKCNAVFPDQWTDDPPVCCGEEAQVIFVKPTYTEEWGGPRQILNLRDEPFGSRSELNTFLRENNLALGASAEKHGGARNESHLNLGRIYSFGK
jgi:hypothetical protein